MAAAAKAETVGEAGGEGDAPRRSKKKLILLALPLLLLGAGAGLWFSGVLPGLLGMNAAPPVEEAAAEEVDTGPRPPEPAVFVAMPDIVANLNSGNRRPVFIRLRSQIEVRGQADATALQAAMPRLLDLFTTYLREVRPEELRGSAGTHRLREELIARANIAATPVRVTDVLFTEILVQ
ncbi:flagellar basal body-associated FliL family protein [Roseococcus suduntuyensis]|uniref:Flagellar protein FliL n=1 Tax=Roseococcus suduntuyensis TaxID=455361 RepID=A0A840AG92_9PROT|nr:flagellar basal body-associated FliL family protein [Roseococcus suduntuyensis]MBB3899194.1 flagellar FliL protein [Roseococcus suduntuyensis]